MESRSRSLEYVHDQGGCHGPATWCGGRMGHGANRYSVNSFQKWPLGGVITVSAAVVPPTVSLSVLKAFPGSHLAAVQFQTKIPTGSKVMAILLKCVMTCKIIETVTPRICVL